MLNAYMQRTQQLLADMKQELINPAVLISFVNTARGQLAGEAECIRALCAVATVVSQRTYPFSVINVGTPATTGIRGVINVHRIQYASGSGQQWIPTWPWEYFDLHYYNNPTPVNGAPARWAQYGQGSAGTSTGSGASGSFFIDPPPDAIYSLNCDCVCYPIALVNEQTVEAIPYLWTDAVPFFAAYLAYLTVQQHDKAKIMFEIYTQFKDRARRSANPSVMRNQYEQSGPVIPVVPAGIQIPGGRSN